MYLHVEDERPRHVVQELGGVVVLLEAELELWSLDEETRRLVRFTHVDDATSAQECNGVEQLEHRRRGLQQVIVRRVTTQREERWNERMMLPGGNWQ
jgi:hypothetical protein